MPNHRKKRTLAIDVTAPGEMEDSEIVRIVNVMLNSGYTDAQNTVESGEGNVADAQAVTNITITKPFVIDAIKRQ